MSTIEDYAQQGANVLGHLEIERCAWVGHCLGVYILAAVGTHSERISHALFAYSTPLADNSADWQRRDDAMQTIRAEGIERFLREEIPTYSTDQANREDVEFGTRLGLTYLPLFWQLLLSFF